MKSFGVFLLMFFVLLIVLLARPGFAGEEARPQNKTDLRKDRHNHKSDPPKEAICAV